MDLTVEKLVVVIRSAGERTLNACVELVRSQIENDSIIIIEEFPFEQALRKCYQLAIGSQKEWLLTIDADMFITKNAISNLLERGLSSEDDVFQLQGLIFDKLTYSYRNAGPRLYRSKYLQKALEFLPEDRTTIRPEYSTIGQMRASGLKSIETGELYAIHDFEQFYFDVYRKSFVHAQKHTNLIPVLIKTWQSFVGIDPDYKIALRGLYDGMLHEELAVIDTRDYNELASIALRDLKMQEKSNIVLISDIYNYVDETVKLAGEIPNELTSKPVNSTVSTKISTIITEKGFLKSLLFFLGVAFTRVGQKFKTF